MIYYGETLPKKRSVTIQYDSVPAYYCILFDIQDKITGKYWHYTQIQKEADRLGLQMAQVIYDNALHKSDLESKVTDVYELQRILLIK